MVFARVLWDNFLGHAPAWYKGVVLLFLAVNPFALNLVGPLAAGWLLVAEFIFTLAMALKCYPLQPGGLLAIEAVMIGMASPDQVYKEVVLNLPVIMLLMFMVAGIFFMKDLLLASFTQVLLAIRQKWLLSLTFCLVAAVLSAFLDALTVTAVIITVALGFYVVYHETVAGFSPHNQHGVVTSKANDADFDARFPVSRRGELEQFRRFLRSLMMHGVVGTALGGVATLVGEPQNLLIAKQAGWHFVEFFLRVAPVSIPVLIAGLVTCVVLERRGWFGYGTPLPEAVRDILTTEQHKRRAELTSTTIARLAAQAVAAILLVVALALHVAEVGFIGLAVLVFTTALTGVVDEHRLGKAFEEAMPFTSLLVIFFVIVAVIDVQHLFSPVVHWALGFSGRVELALLYLVNGVLSMVSDNVFVASVYMKEIATALQAGHISPAELQRFAVVINAGTNIPSVATPNGQAAFLFLLTSGLAPLIRLSYGRMVWMTLPYAIVLTTVGLLAVVVLVPL